MEQLYDVELTRPAKAAYLQLHEEAQAQLDAGQSEHPAVTTINAVDEAIDTTLPNNPCDPARVLAGRLSFMYALPLDTVTICYTVNPGKLTVVVLTICEVDQSRSVFKWLSNAIDKGEVDMLLASLGLNHPCAKVEVNSRLLH
jgi:hypothetical protein